MSVDHSRIAVVFRFCNEQEVNPFGFQEYLAGKGVCISGLEITTLVKLFESYREGLKVFRFFGYDNPRFCLPDHMRRFYGK